MTKKVVLLVDDEPDILELMQEEFAENDFHTITASSGNEAIAILKVNVVDVIVSDYKMPNGNGMTLLQYVNSIKHRPLFFFVSGQADVSVEDALIAGAKRFFSKPFKLEELITAVNEDLV